MTTNETTSETAFTGTNTYRKGTTVIVLRGERVGSVGRILAVGRRDGAATGWYMVETTGRPVAASIHHSDLIRAPHAWSWYDGIHATHRCDDCDAAQWAVQAANPHATPAAVR